MAKSDRVDIAVSVGSEDRARLGSVLGSGNVDRILQIVLTAGATEARDYATGRAVFSTMADLRTYRIYCLLREGLSVPEAESVVAALFKVSQDSARRAVAKTVDRYSVELSEHLIEALADVVKSADWDVDGAWTISLPPGLLRKRILELAEQSDKANPTPRRQGSLWDFPNETYAWIRSKLGLDPREPPK